MRNGPFILLKIGDRNLELIEARRILGKFFITKEGCFELDGEYEYRLNGQPFYIYNLQNSKPISLIAVEEIQDLYRNNKIDILVDELERVEKAVSESKVQGNTLKIIKHLGMSRMKPPELGGGLDENKLVADEFAKKAETVTQETAKFLIEQILYDDKDTNLLVADSMLAKKALEVTSPMVGTNMPTLIFAGLGISLLVVMSQLPHWIHLF